MAAPSRGQINSRAGGGGDADHEIAGGRRDFGGDLHGDFVGDDLHDAGADSQNAGNYSGGEHDADRPGNAGHLVGNFAAEMFIEIGTVQTEGRCQTIVLNVLRKLLAKPSEYWNQGDQQENAEENVQSAGVDVAGNIPRAKNAPAAVETSKNIAMRTLVIRSFT